MSRPEKEEGQSSKSKNAQEVQYHSSTFEEAFNIFLTFIPGFDYQYLQIIEPIIGKMKFKKGQKIGLVFYSKKSNLLIHFRYDISILGMPHINLTIQNKSTKTIIHNAAIYWDSSNPQQQLNKLLKRMSNQSHPQKGTITNGLLKYFIEKFEPKQMSKKQKEQYLKRANEKYLDAIQKVYQKQFIYIIRKWLRNPNNLNELNKQIYQMEQKITGARFKWVNWLTMFIEFLKKLISTKPKQKCGKYFTFNDKNDDNDSSGLDSSNPNISVLLKSIEKITNKVKTYQQQTNSKSRSFKKNAIFPLEQENQKINLMLQKIQQIAQNLKLFARKQLKQKDTSAILIGLIDILSGFIALIGPTGGFYLLTACGLGKLALRYLNKSSKISQLQMNFKYPITALEIDQQQLNKKIKIEESQMLKRKKSPYLSYRSSYSDIWSTVKGLQFQDIMKLIATIAGSLINFIGIANITFGFWNFYNYFSKGNYSETQINLLKEKSVLLSNQARQYRKVIEVTKQLDELKFQSEIILHQRTNILNIFQKRKQLTKQIRLFISQLAQQLKKAGLAKKENGFYRILSGAVTVLGVFTPYGMVVSSVGLVVQQLCKFKSLSIQSGKQNKIAYTCSNIKNLQEDLVKGDQYLENFLDIYPASLQKFLNLQSGLKTNSWVTDLKIIMNQVYNFNIQFFLIGSIKIEIQILNWLGRIILAEAATLSSIITIQQIKRIILQLPIFLSNKYSVSAKEISLSLSTLFEGISSIPYRKLVSKLFGLAKTVFKGVALVNGFLGVGIGICEMWEGAKEIQSISQLEKNMELVIQQIDMSTQQYERKFEEMFEAAKKVLEI